MVEHDMPLDDDSGKCRTEGGGSGTWSEIVLSGKQPQLGDLVRNGMDFDMRGMLPPSEARMRMGVRQVGKRGRWTYRDWIRWRFLWKFFPWYARELRYRGDFCIGASCMHWFWEDPDKKERGYCSAAVSRTQNMMWAKELEESNKPALGSREPALGSREKGNRAS